MKLWMHAAILIICGTVSMQAETLRGTVKDAITGEPLIGATVRVVELQGAAAVTDIDGNYLINISQGGRYTIESTYIGRDDLRHIRALHWDYDNQMHVGEMVCNAQIADRVVSILRQLFDAQYPIQRMLLPDVYDADDETQMRDNNSSSFCYRAIAGSTKLSKHARGLAIDINTLYNPYYKDRNDGTRFIQPATAEKYCDRTWDFPYKIDHDDLCFRLFTEAGFEWGGDWTSCKDFQHFELIEE